MYKKTHRFICVTGICALTFSLTFSSTAVYAEPVATDGQVPSTYSSSFQELESLTKDIENTAAAIDTTNAELVQTQADIDSIQVEQAQQYADMKDRIKYLYESGNDSLFSMLCDAKSMTDFLNKAYFIETISSYDREMLTDMQKTNDKLVAKQNALTSQQEALTTQKAEMDAKHEQLAANLTASDPIAGQAGDLELLAAIIECEAGTSDYDALLAVGACVINRVKDPAYPDNIHDVIYAQGQFAPVWEGKLDKALGRGASELCVVAAQDAMNGATNIGDLKNFRMYPGSLHTGLVIGGNVFF